MYVCICKNVTEKDIYSCMQQGAKSYRQLQKCTGLGTQCGRCASFAKATTKEISKVIASEAESQPQQQIGFDGAALA